MLGIKSRTLCITNPCSLIVRYLKIVYDTYLGGIGSHAVVLICRQRAACRSWFSKFGDQTEIFRLVSLLAKSSPVLPPVLRMKYISFIPIFHFHHPPPEWREKPLQRILSIFVLSSKTCIVLFVPTLNLQL